MFTPRRHRPLPPSRVLALQRTIGNGLTGHLLQRQERFERTEASATGQQPGAQGSLPPERLEQFTHDFNREFAAQLHVFAEGSAERAAERGPDVTAPDVGAASGDLVPAERLVALFTPMQIEKLAGFMTTHIIPERLFNGDEVGTTTAQQRILLSGHILATGQYVPGSFEQRLHARMCGHWVNLVLHYAGASEGRGAGVREQFDHAGGLSLGVETDADGNPIGGASRETLGREFGLGRRGQAAAGARAQFELQGLPFEQLTMLEPGDWLWVYNDNGSPGGNHSVVFSRWASDEMTFPQQTPPEAGGVRYRRAITMSQISPEAGGREETRLLGERFVDTGNGRVTPVTHISRVAATARPMTTVADLVAILGTGPEAAQNHAFIERQTRGRGTFDWAALAQYLRRRNEVLITELGPHMTEQQQRIFLDTNTSLPAAGAEPGSAEGEIPLLVRLNERLRILVTNAQALDEGMAGQGDRIEGGRAAALERTRPQRERLETQIELLQAELDTLERDHAPIAAQVELYATHSSALRAAYVERRQKRQRRATIRTELRTLSLEDDVRSALITELNDIDERLTELAPNISRLETEERDTRQDRRDAQRAERRAEGGIRQRTRRLVDLQRRLAGLVASTGYYTAHGRVGRDAFNGRGEGRRGGVTGLLSNLVPVPDWSQFIQTEASAERPTAPTTTLH